MPFDLSKILAKTGRAVRSLEKDGKPARVVALSQVYDTDLDGLWDAVTTPERLRRWFGNVSGDLQLGGRFQIEANASGTIVDCRPPELVIINWEFGATISFVSNIPGQTQTLPSAIYALLQVPEGEAQAMRLVLVSVVIAIGAVLVSEWLARRMAARR